MKSLGLLITSDRYFHYVVALVRAAHTKGVAVHVHLTGTALHLSSHPKFGELEMMAEITTSSGDGPPLPAKNDGTMPCGHDCLDAEKLTGFLRVCDRHIVF
jgi:hypothetical protein